MHLHLAVGFNLVFTWRGANAGSSASSGNCSRLFYRLASLPLRLTVSRTDTEIEFLLNVVRQALSLMIQRGCKYWIVLLDQLIEQRVFGLVTFVARRWIRQGAPCR